MFRKHIRVKSYRFGTTYNIFHRALEQIVCSVNGERRHENVCYTVNVVIVWFDSFVESLLFKLRVDPERKHGNL